jgi:predicted metal-binding membrane protein
MANAARGYEGLPAVLGLTMAAAWGVLALGAGGVVLPDFCAPMTLWAGPAAASLGLALALNPPATLAAGWALMLAAIMPPLIAAPLRHVRGRSFANRRARSMLLFAAGYAAVWMAAGTLLGALPFAARLAVPGSLPLLVITALAALLWQVSPAKQQCLNRCHQQPSLAAFGAAADRDVVCYGLSHGAWCVGACWALMLPPLVIERGHVPAMIATALFLCAERLERPAPATWRWRAPGKALRIAMAQARLRLMPHAG